MKPTVFLLFFGPAQKSRHIVVRKKEKMAADGAREDYDVQLNLQGHNPFMVRHVRVWSRPPTVQLVLGSSDIHRVQELNVNKREIPLLTTPTNDLLPSLMVEVCLCLHQM